MLICGILYFGTRPISRIEFHEIVFHERPFSRMAIFTNDYFHEMPFSRYIRKILIKARFNINIPININKLRQHTCLYIYMSI